MSRMNEAALDLLPVLQCLPGCYLILRTDAPRFTVEAVTDDFLKVTYMKREEIVGKGFFEIFAVNFQEESQSLDRFRDSLFSVMEHRKQHCLEMERYDQIDPSTGSVQQKMWSVVNRPVVSANGHLQYIIHAVHDITRKVEQERSTNEAVHVLEEKTAGLQKGMQETVAEVENQKHFIRKILDASLNGVYALQALHNESGEIIDFRYLFVNSVAAAFVGLPEHEILGNTMLSLIPENKTNGIFEIFCRLLREQTSAQDQIWFESQRFRGWFEYSASPIGTNMLVVTLQDITVLKESLRQSEQQRNLLDNILKYSPSAITVTAFIRNGQNEVVDGRTIMANDIAEKYVGIPLDVMLTKSISEIDPAIITSPLFQKALHTLQTGESFITQYFIEPSGKWIELAVAKMDGHHLINVFTDVTSIKEVQLQMERFVEDLKQSNANLEEFAYAASHDMKEPIRKINFFTDRLKSELKGLLTVQQQHLFQRLELAGKRIGTLVDDLLLYSHVSKSAAVKEPVDLAEKIALILEDLELQIQEKKARITVGPLPVVTGYRRQLQQLFQNLISNALKYSKPGHQPVVNITSRESIGKEALPQLHGDAANKLFNLISISDNGIGFLQQDAEKIFNLFTRLHGNAEYSGSGIGLSIAQKVVQNHKGHIWAAGEPGKGSTFNVLLPVESEQ